MDLSLPLQHPISSPEESASHTLQNATRGIRRDPLLFTRHGDEILLASERCEMPNSEAQTDFTDLEISKFRDTRNNETCLRDCLAVRSCKGLFTSLHEMSYKAVDMRAFEPDDASVSPSNPYRCFSADLVMAALSGLASPNRKVVDEHLRVIMACLRQFERVTADFLVQNGFLDVFSKIKSPNAFSALSFVARTASPELLEQRFPQELAQYLYKGCLSSVCFYVFSDAVDSLVSLVVACPRLVQRFKEAGMDLLNVVERVNAKTEYLEYADQELTTGDNVNALKFIDEQIGAVDIDYWDKSLCDKAVAKIVAAAQEYVEREGSKVEKEMATDGRINQYITQKIKERKRQHKNAVMKGTRTNCFVLLSVIFRSDTEVGPLFKLLTVIMHACHQNQDEVTLSHVLTCLSIVVSRDPQQFAGFLATHPNRSELLQLTKRPELRPKKEVLHLIDCFISNSVHSYTPDQLLRSLIPFYTVPATWDDSLCTLRALDILTMLAPPHDKLVDAGVFSLLCTLMEKANTTVRHNACNIVCTSLTSLADTDLLEYVQENSLLQSLFPLLESDDGATVSMVCQIILRIVMANQARGSRSLADTIEAAVPWDLIDGLDVGRALRHALFN